MNNEQEQLNEFSNLSEFENYINQKYNDNLGDVYVVSFLKRYPGFYKDTSNANSKNIGLNIDLKTWEEFIKEGRKVIEVVGGKYEGETLSVETIKAYAKKILGAEAGKAFGYFYEDYVVNTKPAARTAVVEDSLQDFKSKYGNGISNSQQNFGYNFGVACADYAIEMIEKDPDQRLENGISRFGKAILNLNDAEFSYAVSDLIKKLPYKFEQYAATVRTGEKILNSDIKMQVAQIISQEEGFDMNKKNAFDNDDVSPTVNAKKKNVKIS